MGLRFIVLLLVPCLVLDPVSAERLSTPLHSPSVTAPFASEALVMGSFISIHTAPAASWKIAQTVHHWMQAQVLTPLALPPLDHVATRLSHPFYGFVIAAVVVAAIYFSYWVTKQLLNLFFNALPKPSEPAADQKELSRGASSASAWIAATLALVGLSSAARATTVADSLATPAMITEPDLRQMRMVPVAKLMLTYSVKYRLPRAMLERMVSAESQFDATAVSHRGAIGLTQLTPETAVWLLGKFSKLRDDVHLTAEDFRPEHLKDPRISIAIGSFYLRYLLDLFNGDMVAAVAAYNAGPGKIARLIDNKYQRTQEMDRVNFADISDDDIRAYARRVTQGDGTTRRAPGYILHAVPKESLPEQFLGFLKPSRKSKSAGPTMDIRLSKPRRNYHRLGIFILGAVLAVGSWVATARAQTDTTSATPAAVPELALNGWVTSYHRGDAGTAFKEYVKRLKELSIFGVDADRKGRMVQDKGLIASVLAALKGESKPPRVLLTVTNDRGRHLKDHTLLANWILTPTRRKAHIDDLLFLSEQVDGLDIDYENLRARDSSAFASFVQELGDRLHANGKYFAVTVETKTLFSDDIDWNALSSHVDRVRVMAYPYHFERTEPGAIAPPVNVLRLAVAALHKMPPEKVEIALPLYGIDWPAHRRGTVVHTRGDYADLTQRPGAQVSRDKTTHSAHIQYVAVRGKGKKRRAIRHEVYFEDSASVNYKVQLLIANGVQNIGFWHLGMASSDLLGLIESQRLLAKHPSEISVPAKNPDAPATVAPKAAPMPIEIPLPENTISETPVSKPSAEGISTLGRGPATWLPGFLSLFLFSFYSGKETKLPRGLNPSAYLTRSFRPFMNRPEDTLLTFTEIQSSVHRNGYPEASAQAVHGDLHRLTRVGILEKIGNQWQLAPGIFAAQAAVLDAIKTMGVTVDNKKLKQIYVWLKKNVPGYVTPDHFAEPPAEILERVFFNTTPGKRQSDPMGFTYVVTPQEPEELSFRYDVSKEASFESAFPEGIQDHKGKKWNLVNVFLAGVALNGPVEPGTRIKPGMYVVTYSNAERKTPRPPAPFRKAA